MAMNNQGRPSSVEVGDAGAGAGQTSGIVTISGDRGLDHEEKLIFELGHGAVGVDLPDVKVADDRLGGMRRKGAVGLPGLSEPETIRHYVRLSRKNYAIDSGLYPLGSCTMKHNPRLNEKMARLPGFGDLHPLAPASATQGALAMISELMKWLTVLTGMPAVAMSPKAGAHGELCGLLAIRAALEARGEGHRKRILVPESAHGTNPATAAFAGFTVDEVPSKPDGHVDADALEAKLGPDVAAIMLTNPNTCGLFEPRVREMADAVHAAGGYFYCDGANFNAIAGKVRPGDLGIDAMHINLHKTFSTPHGGGGPGAGAVGVSARLEPFLPVPLVGSDEQGHRWLDETDRPQSIGRLSAFMGNAGVLLRAYIYMRMLGRDGMARVGEFATLNANYLQARLRDAGYELAYPTRRASHEFILTLRREAKEFDVTAMDIAKRLLDFGIHAPTTYFPMLVPECLLIEPTETESPETLDGFVEAMVAILADARSDPARLKAAPYTMPVRRLDDVRAAKQLDLTWKPVQ
jgi:glycine dehydrogenase subunit 2